MEVEKENEKRKGRREKKIIINNNNKQNGILGLVYYLKDSSYTSFLG